MPCSHHSSHCTFHLGLIWRFVFEHENGYHHTELLGHPFIHGSQEWGYGGGLPLLGFPHHDPFSFIEKESLEKERKDKKLEFVSCAFCATSPSSSPREDFGAVRRGVTQSEEGKEPTDARTPLAIIKIHSSGLYLHLPCTDWT